MDDYGNGCSELRPFEKRRHFEAISSATFPMASVTSGEGALPGSNRLPSMP
jgi:hypothetical protein